MCRHSGRYDELVLVDFKKHARECQSRSTAEVLYMYGGWDGSHDLGDFWKFDIAQRQWTCLCQDTSLVVSGELVLLVKDIVWLQYTAV